MSDEDASNRLIAGSMPEDSTPSLDQACPPILELDPRSDLTLTVGSALAGHNDKKPRTFRVCSKTMARVSPVFDRMLYGHFAESRPDAGGGGGDKEWIVDLPNDDPASFELFARIAHGNFKGMRRRLPLSRLYDLTTLTHYYDATPLLAPWCHAWISSIPSGTETPDEEAEGLSMAKLLWVCWELGNGQLFESTARRMVMECPRVVLAEDSDLHDLQMPPDIIKQITSIRNRVLDSILELFREFTKTLVIVDEGPRWCHHASWLGPHRCESMILGSLTFCLTRAGLWPLPESAAAIESSVVQLYSTISNLIIHDIGRVVMEKRSGSGVDHAECNPRGFLMGSTKDILADVPSPVTDAHWKALTEQVEKLGL